MTLALALDKAVAHRVVDPEPTPLGAMPGAVDKGQAYRGSGLLSLEGMAVVDAPGLTRGRRWAYV